MSATGDAAFEAIVDHARARALLVEAAEQARATAATLEISRASSKLHSVQLDLQRVLSNPIPDTQRAFLVSALDTLETAQRIIQKAQGARP